MLTGGVTGRREFRPPEFATSNPKPSTFLIEVPIDMSEDWGAFSSRLTTDERAFTNAQENTHVHQTDSLPMWCPGVNADVG